MSLFRSSVESSWVCMEHVSCRVLPGLQLLCWDPLIFLLLLFPPVQEKPRKTMHWLRFSLETTQRHIASPLTIKVLFSCGGKQRFWLEKVFPSWLLLVAALWSRKAFRDVPRYGCQGGEMGLWTQRWYKTLCSTSSKEPGPHPLLGQH